MKKHKLADAALVAALLLTSLPPAGVPAPDPVPGLPACVVPAPDDTPEDPASREPCR